MALKQYNPTSPARRGLVLIDRASLYKGAPVKSLTEGLKKTGGRNNMGHATARGIGGGHKRSYRTIDFRRRTWDVEATVERLEYIRRAKELGFTLAEIRELLELSFTAHAGCEHIRQRAEAMLADIEDKIRSLQKMRRSLGNVLGRCKAKDAPADCPLVHDTNRTSAG